MANFNSLLSAHLSRTFASLQSRYSTTPTPSPPPFNQSPSFTNFYKCNPSTLQWSPSRPPPASHQHIPPATTNPENTSILIFSWNIAALISSHIDDPRFVAGAIEELVNTLPEKAAPAVLLLQNVPVEVLPVVLAHPFFRRRFLCSDIDALQWPALELKVPAKEGGVVFVDSRLEEAVAGLFRVRLVRVGGDVAFVDVKIGGVVVRVGTVWVERGKDGAGEAIEGVVQWVKAEGVGIGILGGGEYRRDEGVENVEAFIWAGKEGALRIDGDGTLREKYGLFQAELKIERSCA
ncbi:hypothetical protein RUND412_007751 [Rhizina undulata]